MNTKPNDMLVEITNRCNQACVFCAHRKMHMKQGEIDPDLMKRVLQEAYDMGVRRVGLYTTGEMFLCKEIETHIHNAKKIGFNYVYADTNGALATKENMRKVLLGGVLIVSNSLLMQEQEKLIGIFTAGTILMLFLKIWWIVMH